MLAAWCLLTAFNTWAVARYRYQDGAWWYGSLGALMWASAFVGGHIQKLFQLL